MPNFKVLSHFRLRKWLSKVKKRVLTPSFSHLTFSSQMGTLSTQWTLFQSFSIVKSVSRPMASTPLFKMRLKSNEDSSQKGPLMGGGVPEALMNPVHWMWQFFSATSPNQTSFTSNILSSCHSCHLTSLFSWMVLDRVGCVEFLLAILWGRRTDQNKVLRLRIGYWSCIAWRMCCTSGRSWRVKL